MSGVACPHCQAANPVGGRFCESCGKALPATSAGPRLVANDALPSSAVGQRLMGDELTKMVKRAANTLLTIGIILSVIGVGVLVLANAMKVPNPVAMMIVGGVQTGIGLAFLGLYFWARQAPLPASIVGLVLYLSLVVLNVITHLSSQTESGGRPPGIGIGFLDIIFIVYLSRGIHAAIKSRQLLAQPAPM